MAGKIKTLSKGGKPWNKTIVWYSFHFNPPQPEGPS